MGGHGTSRHARTAAPRPADLRHGSLQLPVHLLHAQGSVRSGLCVPAQGPGPELRGDRARGSRVRGARASKNCGSPAANRSSGASSPRSSRRWPRSGRADGRALDLTLTTNGAALGALARPLADAGLRRVTVSLDSLDDAVFGAMNGVDFPVARVLDGVDAALEAGLSPVKVNMVVRRGVNESSVVPMARWARETGVILRFIEYMDVGHSNGWRLDEVVPAQELIDAVVAASGRPSPRIPATVARSPAGGRTWTASASSGSSRRSRGRSAGTARAPGCRPTASCTRACSPSRAATSVRSCATDRATRTWWRSSPTRGVRATTAIRSSARSPRSDLPKVEMFAMGG